MVFGWQKIAKTGGTSGRSAKQDLKAKVSAGVNSVWAVKMSCIKLWLARILKRTRVGEFWSGQKDSGIGQWPTGTPVLGFGRTYMSLWQLCQGWELKDDRGRAGSTSPSEQQKKKKRSEGKVITSNRHYILSNVLIILQGDVSTGLQQSLTSSSNTGFQT